MSASETPTGARLRMLTLIMKRVWSSSAKGPKPVSLLGPCSRTDEPRPRKRQDSSEVTPTTDGQAGRPKQTGKQTDKQGRGNAPESDDASQRLALCSTNPDWADRREGSELPLHRLTHSSPLTSRTAGNEWRRGCLPQGTLNNNPPKNKKNKNKPQHGGRAAPLTQETLMDGAQ